MLLKVFKESPIIPEKWVLDEKFSEIKNDVHNHQQLHESYVAKETAVLSSFEREIFDLDYYPILLRFRTEYQTVFRFFKTQYRTI